MTEIRPDDPLRTLLRTGDPAVDGTEPNAEETATLRRRILNRIPERKTFPRWLPLTAAIAAAVLGIVLLMPSATDSPPASSSPTPGGGLVGVIPGAEAPAQADRRRQIQFASENGTRIIWVLNPDLSL